MNSFNSRFYIRPASGRIVSSFIVLNHYAQCVPGNTQYSFGLFIKETKKMIGVCTFGFSVGVGVQHDCPYTIMELTRIALKENEKNLVSWWVSKCLSLLPKPLLLISYADPNHSHTGCVYQALNWIYTGTAAAVIEYQINGKIRHNIFFNRKFRNNPENTKNAKIIKTKQLPKYRYFYPLGTKKQKKEMKEYIEKRFGIYPYPKGEYTKYDMDEERQKRNEIVIEKGFGI